VVVRLRWVKVAGEVVREVAAMLKPTESGVGATVEVEGNAEGGRGRGPVEVEVEAMAVDVLPEVVATGDREVALL
jgi:hypothetical protein